MKIQYIIFLIISLHSIVLQAQENGECVEITNNKAIKYYKMGLDKKKYEYNERKDFLEEAIAIEPDYVDAYFVLGTLAIKVAKTGSASFKRAETEFLQVIALCPQYHASPYYFLGQIYLGKEDFEKAAQYLKQFLDFHDDDLTKLPKDYKKIYPEALEDYKYATFYRDIYANPVPYNPKIVKNVSTEVSEYLPLISPDNELMLYTRRFVNEREVKDTYIQSDKLEIIERFTISKAIDINTFDGGEPMPDPFNQIDDYNYGGAALSIDNKHLYLTVCSPTVTGYTNCDIYSSDWEYVYVEKDDTAYGHWKELKNLGDSINTKDGWESQPSLSADGRVLYFASAREDSRGIDVYKSEKDSNGIWRKAQNIGEPINTEYNDKSPFVHSDSKTLYFSSQGHQNIGGYDVLYSKMDDNGKWMEPKNIGYPINTKDDEHGFVISTDGKDVYFSSDKLKGEGGGGLDIFTFELYKEARPEKVQLLTGHIKDEKGKVVTDAKIELKNIKTKEIKQIQIDTMDGKYAVMVPMKENEEIVMNVKSEGAAFNARLFSTKDTVPKAIRKVDVKIMKVTTQKPYKLNDINYTTNSAELTRESLYLLDEFIDYLKENSSMTIAIHGHTDNVGTESDNAALSSDRAYSVLAYLQEHGIAKYRLSFKGFGESKPLATNNTEEGRAMNRRTEFVILSK